MTDSVGAIGRSTRALTLGSVAAQAMSALSQFLLVAWLTPDDFGLFAAASAALIVCVALTNLGEVNAFLTGKITEPERLLRTTRIVNAALAVAGCTLAAIVYISGNARLGTMIALVSLVIPMTGSSLAWNAIAIRASDLRVAISGQFVGAGVKLVSGVAIAALTQSAIALPLALGAGALANSLTTRHFLTDLSDHHSDRVTQVRPRFDRARWGAQSLVQFFGAQVDYLVLAVLASPHILGIYFLAYQATVGVSALVSGPLLKSGLVELGRAQAGDVHVTRTLALQTSGYVAVLSAVGAAVVTVGSPHFPGAWSAAGSPLVMLLGSLTGRLLTPVLEAQLLASGQVGRSFFVNGADVIGTALAALVVLTGDILLVALAVSTWKVGVSCLRCLAVFNARGILIAMPALASLMVHAAAGFGAPQGSLVGAGSLLAFGVLAYCTLPALRVAL